MRLPLTSLATTVGVVRRACAIVFGVACAMVSIAAGADSLAVVDPLPPGPYAVGCSNVEQDFSRVLAGETASN